MSTRLSRKDDRTYIGERSGAEHGRRKMTVYNHRVAGARFAEFLILALFPVACGDVELSEARAFPDACGPDRAPDEACYVEKRNPESKRISLATKIARRYIDEHPADDTEEMAWDWAEGVLMMSMAELYRVTGDEELRNYYRRWLDAHIEQGYEMIWSDSCPPAVAALALYQENGKEKYKKVIDDVMAYLEDESLPTEDGAFAHLGPESDTVWVDSLFMFGIILSRWGEYTDKGMYLDTIGEQFLIFGKLLQDDSGFFRHTRNWPPSTETDIYWARGNGWALASGYEYLRARRQRAEEDRAVAGRMSKMVNALLEAQDDKSGLWWNILNRPGEIYVETSASALFAYGMARGYRYGYLDEEVLPVIEKAMEGIESKIAEDDDGRPVVTGISGQTTAGNYDDYAAVPLEEDMDFGVGAVILALIETSGLAQ
jgi:unsaturated rhamnogalacturonyl hydrolase